MTLPFDPDPSLAELFAAVEPTRRRFLDQGYAEEAVGSGGLDLRDHGFGAIERELFRSDAHLRPRLKLGDFKILGGPRGEGGGLLIAREVRDELIRGRHPDEILILVPRMDEDAELVRGVLRSWGLPVAGGPGRRLAMVPAVSALRLAMKLPAENWDVGTLVRLLRNGQARWGTDPAFDPFEAAAAIRATRVFRDRENIRRALERSLRDEMRKDVRSERAGRAALDHLSGLLDPVARPGRWRTQVDRLGKLADGLGLDPDELDPLRDALEDQSWVFDQLGPAVAETSWTWPEFVDEVEAIISDALAPVPTPSPGAIRIEAVGDSEGARAEVVILANLAEKTFPTPDSVDLGSAGAPSLAFSREMLRFARAVGSADSRLILAYPTSDLDGSPLLPAGFLDDLLRRLDPETREACVEEHARFDPVLADHPDLAGSRADARVLAVAMACRDGSDGRLRVLAGSHGHTEPLAAAAETFRIARHRRESRLFGPYDGRLLDPAAIGKVREAFGPDHVFSASQLESFALCPFQFFQRYALGLKPADDLDELEEDYAGRGQDVHRFLEEIHQQMATEGSANLILRLPVLVETSMRIELERFGEGEADVAEVLREIEARRNEKALARYVHQFQAYGKGVGKDAVPHRFEVQFGQPEKPDSLPVLTIGEAAGSVRLQGIIDRIDLIHADGRVGFRVIDYKTGSHPSKGDVQSGLASQLPLYAMAVERLLGADGDRHFDGAGYWSLPKDGYKGIKFDDWSAYRDRLESFILALVDKLREGTFPVFSQKKDCPKFCDFPSVCRCKEVRAAEKAWDDRPSLEDES